MDQDWKKCWRCGKELAPDRLLIIVTVHTPFADQLGRLPGDSELDVPICQACHRTLAELEFLLT